MSRAQTRHHRERVIKNRIKKIKLKWRLSAMNDTAWVESTAKAKTNPFTRCSCEMCQEPRSHKRENKRARKQARLIVKGETNG